VDPELAAWASKRATQLILQICGGQVEGSLSDIYSRVAAPRKIACRPKCVESLLGISIQPDATASILKRLGCNVISSNEILEVTPPSHRMDLEREVDLIEEVGRVYGIKNISGKIPSISLSTTKDSASFLFTRELGNLLVSMGIPEASHYTLVSSEEPCTVEGGKPHESLRLINPLTSEMDCLRPSLFNGLIKAVSRNLAGGNRSIAFFETGKIFNAQDGQLQESSSLGIILAGEKQRKASWEKGREKTPFDFYDLKGILQTLFNHLGVAPTQWDFSSNNPLMELGKSFSLQNGKQIVGHGGQIKTSVAHSFKVAVPAFYVELNFDWLAKSKESISKYQPWTIYPGVERDLAITLDQKQKHEHIETTLMRLAKKHAEPKGIFLRQIEIFDIFTSEKIGMDKKSIAYSMTYLSPQKTLTDVEVNEVHEAIKKNLKTELVCELRE